MAILYDANKYKSFGFSVACAAASFFFFPIAPLLYLSLRSRYVLRPSTGGAFCSRCGYSSFKPMSTCPKCHNKLTL